MTTVRVEPSGVEFDVGPKESVAEAAWRQGFTWPTKCFGQAECMVCFVKVVDGELGTAPPGDDELFAMRTQLPRRLRTPLTRLACRLQITRPGVVLEKKGVQPPPDGD
jgi:2Fe-2S ferredoxin